MVGTESSRNMLHSLGSPLHLDTKCFVVSHVFCVLSRGVPTTLPWFTLTDGVQIGEVPGSVADATAPPQPQAWVVPEARILYRICLCRRFPPVSGGPQLLRLFPTKRLLDVDATSF
ncbi:hypothetical protein SCAR479_13300 [Seiridium cardinale]|uniref:Uncharacterized protein n=1 Tax=Seiridium cardinale TaxID=138064 RepID=A0ABR2X8C9_9PEZI